MPTVKTSVVIVSYNSEAFIKKCIDSILKKFPANNEIIVLDNHSSDSTTQNLKKFGNKINLIESGENLGFAKGCNLAVKKAKGEYLFILNPDTEIEQSISGKMINFYENTDDIGIVAPKLVMPNGQTQPSVRKLPTVWGAFKEYILGIKHAYSQYVPEGDKPQEVEVVYGAAWLIKKDLFEKLGGFDEKFFLYYEDTDFCQRLRQLSKKVYYYPKVLVNHLVGGTKSEIDKNKLNSESAQKYHGWLNYLLLQLIFRLRRFAP